MCHELSILVNMMMFLLEKGDKIGCGAAQLVVRRLAVRQARVPSRHPIEAPLAERRRDEDSRRRASANGEG
jgi:hypothetical protein